MTSPVYQYVINLVVSLSGKVQPLSSHLLISEFRYKTNHSFSLVPITIMYISQCHYFSLSQYLSKYVFLLLLLCRLKIKTEAGLGLTILSLQQTLISAKENNCSLQPVTTSKHYLRWPPELKSLRRAVRRLFNKDWELCTEA